MATWLSYPDTVQQHTVVGELLVTRALHSPQLDNERDLFVWLPPSYRTQPDRRYPVLYMHDGQNLFDAHASFVGEWGVDETLTALASEGIEVIVVGLPNNERRRWEYNPYPSSVAPEYDGRGEDYLRFIVETVKPLIDSEFRTKPDLPHTGIAGSSMGGLISLYALLTRPDIFSVCGSFSPAYWYGDEGLARTIPEKAIGAGRLYMDIGTAEGYIFAGIPDPFTVYTNDGDAAYLTGVHRLRDLLLQNGYVPDQNFRYVEEPGAIHHENAWAKRLPSAFRWLLAGF